MGTEQYTICATQFTWTLENGSPATATGRNPTGITYTTPGAYRIKLEAANDRGEKDTLSKLITVQPSLSADIEIEPSFDVLPVELKSIEITVNINGTPKIFKLQGSVTTWTEF